MRRIPIFLAVVLTFGILWAASPEGEILNDSGTEYDLALALWNGGSGTDGGADPAGRAAVSTGRGFPIIFDSEVIRISIPEEDSLEVDGLYRLVRRPSNRARIHLFYPYPRDSLLGGARMLLLEGRATGRDRWSPLSYQERESSEGSRWEIPLGPEDTLEVRAVYRQALKSTYARYIVTTTAAWDRPLRSARFEIRLPEGAEPLEFSFPFERTDEEGRPVWIFEARHFLPDRDITVTWK